MGHQGIERAAVSGGSRSIRPTLGDERTNWRRFAANAAVLAVYWTMAAALLAAAIGMTWLATVLAWSVCVLAVPAVVMGRL